MVKKILVLGIGPSQVDLIKAVKEMNFEVVACAYENEGPGKQLVDGFRQIDIKNTEAVKQYAQEENVDFIYSMGLEMALPIITEVSEDLNLPNFFSKETLSLTENKAVWRENLGDIKGNIHSQRGTKVSDFKNWNFYPSILKPVDGSGQRGVTKVQSFSDVQRNFETSIKYSKSKQLILEEFIDGPEISVNSFVQNGELQFAIISDRISYDEYPGGIIKEHYIPSRIVETKAKEIIENLVKEVNKKMGFVNGHIYYQMKVENGIPKLVEFTPRFDGCHMWRLVYEATGLDLRKVALELLAYGYSESLKNYDGSKNYKSVETHFISDKPGITINKANYDIPENCLYLEWYYNEGEKVKTVTGYMEKLGYYIIAN